MIALITGTVLVTLSGRRWVSNKILTTYLNYEYRKALGGHK